MDNRLHVVRYVCLVLALVAFIVPLLTADPSRASTTFSDGFENGDLATWTSNVGLVAQQEVVFSGAWAARATGPGKSYAYEQLASPSADATYAVMFDVLSRSTPVDLLRVQTASGTNLVTILINKAGKLSV